MELPFQLGENGSMSIYVYTYFEELEWHHARTKHIRDHVTF